MHQKNKGKMSVFAVAHIIGLRQQHAFLTSMGKASEMQHQCFWLEMKFSEECVCTAVLRADLSVTQNCWEKDL